MTFEELKKVNEGLATLDVKGKAYVQVNTRVVAFRQLFPNGTITTDIVDKADGIVTMKASVMDENGKLLGTGYAQEKESSSYINKTSYIENCETSAVGRALAMVGIGTDASMCSAEELVNAITQQNAEQAKEDKRAEAVGKEKAGKVMVQTIRDSEGFDEAVEKLIVEGYKIKSLDDLTVNQYKSLVKNWKETVAKAHGQWN